MMTLNTDIQPIIKNVIEQYPKAAQEVFNQLHQCIYTAAQELNINTIEETLKWGEPSFLVKSGSTIRIDWKAKTPDHIYIFFNCKSLLVPTIRELYSDTLHTIDNRAIRLDLQGSIDKQALTHCFSMALNYHNIKNKTLLGN